MAGPVIREAMKLGIPAVIHEQNAYPGVTNKALSKKARRTMLAVADAQSHLSPSARCVVTGNPIRPAVLRADRETGAESFGYSGRYAADPQFRRKPGGQAHQ